MLSPLYQCLIFGKPTPKQIEVLNATIARAMEDFGLKPGEHFDAEIIGMNVYNYFPHTYIGTVVDVLSYPAHKLYKVKGEEKTYLIPAVKDIFITDIDEDAREISVHMIEGLETDED